MTTRRWATGSSPTSSTLEHGIRVGENRVHRLCRIAGITASHHKKRSKAGSTGPAPHDDLLAVVDEHGVVRHEFVADGPNKVWLWDISEHPTREGKLYICAIKDVWSNKIVGYSIDSRMKSSPRPGRDAQRHRAALPGRDGVPLRQGRSISRQEAPSGCSRTTAWSGRWAAPTAPATTPAWRASSPCCRRTSSTPERWDTREDLRLAMVTWIETKYNRRRRQRGLGKLTPVEFEMIYATAEAA